MPGHLLLLNCFVGELNFANFIFVIGNSQFPQSGVKSSINYTHSSPRLADFYILSQTKMLDSCTYLYNPYTELTPPLERHISFCKNVNKESYNGIMICYFEGSERQSEEVCTAGSLWFTSRVSVAFCLCFLNKCLENIKQTSK